MTGGLPDGHDARIASHVRPRAKARGGQERPRGAVDSILVRAPPVARTLEDQNDRAPRYESHRRRQVGQVRRAEQADDAGVAAPRRDWIVGLQSRSGALLDPGGYVGPEAKARTPVRVCDSVAGLGRQGRRPNSCTREASPLTDDILVDIEALPCDKPLHS